MFSRSSLPILEFFTLVVVVGASIIAVVPGADEFARAVILGHPLEDDLVGQFEVQPAGDQRIARLDPLTPNAAQDQPVRATEVDSPFVDPKEESASPNDFEASEFDAADFDMELPEADELSLDGVEVDAGYPELDSVPVEAIEPIAPGIPAVKQLEAIDTDSDKLPFEDRPAEPVTPTLAHSATENWELDLNPETEEKQPVSEKNPQSESPAPQRNQGNRERLARIMNSIQPVQTQRDASAKAPSEFRQRGEVIFNPTYSADEAKPVEVESSAPESSQRIRNESIENDNSEQDSLGGTGHQGLPSFARIVSQSNREAKIAGVSQPEESRTTPGAAMQIWNSYIYQDTPLDPVTSTARPIRLLNGNSSQPTEFRNLPAIVGSPLPRPDSNASASDPNELSEHVSRKPMTARSQNSDNGFQPLR